MPPSRRAARSCSRSSSVDQRLMTMSIVPARVRMAVLLMSTAKAVRCSIGFAAMSVPVVAATAAIVTIQNDKSRE